MKKIVYKTKKLVLPSEIDLNRNYKLSSILKDIQNIAVDAVESLGIKDELTRDRGFNWVYTKLYIEFNSIPKEKETIYYETYPLDMKHFIYPRQFNVKDSKGDVYFKVLINCVLLDMINRKAATPKETGVAILGYKNKHTIELTMPKTIARNDASYQETRKIHYTDLDINNHLNNVRYFDFILDLFSKDKIDNLEFNSILISFNKEVKLNEELMLYASGDLTYIYGKVNDHIAFEAEVSYVER